MSCLSDKELLAIAEANIKADYESGKISRQWFNSEMAYVWNYRRQLQFSGDEQSV